MKDIERIQGEIEDLIRQDNRDFDFDNICPTIDWRDTKAIAEYVIKARIEREETYGVVLENILMNMGIELVKTEISQNKERIAELKKGLEHKND